MELRIPKVWVGSFSPELFEPRQRVDNELWARIMTAYHRHIHPEGRRPKALGCDTGVSKCMVSRISAEIDDGPGAGVSRAVFAPPTPTPARTEPLETSQPSQAHI